MIPGAFHIGTRLFCVFRLRVSVILSICLILLMRYAHRPSALHDMSAVSSFIVASLRYVAPRPFRPDYPLRGVAAVRKAWDGVGVCLWGVMEYVAVAENMG